MSYTFDFNAVSIAPLLKGLWVSLELTAAANVIGIGLGFVLALLIMSPYRLVRLPFMLFVEFFRCTPAIIQIVWIFYCVPMIFDVFLDPITMGVMALGLNLMAFNAEAYRAAIQAVPREQLDAGIALGLSPLQRVFYIVFPTAFRASIPVLLTNGIVIFQQSALVAIVAIQDLMYQGKTLATETYRPIETFTVVALIYFVVSFPITQIVGFLERRRLLLVS
ncbi:amino acid ABC transporter permease [Rhizobium hainanense]|uniref:Amino acid ABC transporter membrane protein 1, PAAT family n=1 Tax=Rhizobium hainanense TaxID=52131 RepID=A0A1C3VJT4_9HYPH|nr:amino acid ABC transporter permease [Rhizobium hainanense]SCB28043.1 amino acid ABC transporter membrane protein 1, PAAT family [Rhizobium hainanense]